MQQPIDPGREAFPAEPNWDDRDACDSRQFEHDNGYNPSAGFEEQAAYGPIAARNAVGDRGLNATPH